jgi:4-hydroxybenzoate polyprenyltransferase
MLHETPVRFGKENAQMVMGFQMAVAYIGSTFLPPLFGFIANATSLALLPLFLLVYAALLLLSSERVNALLAAPVRAPEEETGSPHLV